MSDDDDMIKQLGRDLWDGSGSGDGSGYGSDHGG